MTRVSVLDAAQQAMEHTRRHLFPFKFERWLALGFVAFLDQCGRSQEGMRFPTGLPDHKSGGGEGGGHPGEVLSQVGAWLGAHVMVVMAIAAVLLVLLLCFTALVLWINSRGVFMYLDNVATGRADVSRPWREHTEKADSYFAWSFGLTVGVLSAGMILLVAAGLIVLPMVRGGGFAAGRIAALVALAAMFLVLLLATVLASVALHDFVAPLQMKMRSSCGAAMDVFLGLLRANGGAFVVYVLLKIVFSMLLAFALLVAACLTCCCALIPVITQTVLQPLFYFERAWPVFLLGQMGHDLIPPVPPAPLPPSATPPPPAPPTALPPVPSPV